MLVIYHDIMDADQCDLLMREHDANPSKHVENPLDATFDNRVLFLQRMSPAVQEVAAIITVEVGKIISRHFRTDLYPETVSTVRWSAGEEMALHRDGQNPHTISRTHSVVIYLNDQETGGEIYFPEMGAVISPRRALMVAYEKTVLHGVRPVLSPRYTLTLWYSDQPAVSVFR